MFKIYLYNLESDIHQGVSLKECEIKIPIKDLETIEQNLRELGAVLISYREEYDYYIDTRPCIDLLSSDSALRVRVSRDINNGNTYHELTFKGPREEQGFAKVRMELSVLVNDATKLLEILSALGFKIVTTIFKKRKIYQYGDYRIYLDDVEGLGKFIEIEFIVDKNKASLALNRILYIVEKLNMPKDFITKSYLELILEKEAEIKR